MSVGMVGKPLNKIKKIRSLDELFTRGGQAISAFREKRGGQVPTDEEFTRRIDRSFFGTSPIIAETLWQKFFVNGKEKFFPSFRDSQRTAAEYSAIFGDKAAERFVNAGESIVDGRIDLLGLRGLYVGNDVDWHREPVSSKRSPLRHWKEFNDLDTSETGNTKITWELNRHQHFFTLGLAYLVNADERMAETFARHLGSWMDQNPPGMGINWASSLEVGLRAISWLWAFHFFRDSEHFTPLLLKKAIKFLYLHGRHIEKYLSKYYSPNTHLTGEALALYYLGTQLPFLDRAKHWRQLGEDILLAEITKQVLPDGVYFEQSTWYQRYTVDIYLHFTILRSLQGEPYYTAAAAELENRLQKACDFLMYMTLPDGRTPIIGDDDGGRILPLTLSEPDDFRGSLALASIIFDRSDYKFVSSTAGEEVFWLTGEEGTRAYEALESKEPELASVGFTEGGYFVMRDGWTDTDNFLVVDCGILGALSGGHGHADALSIETAVRGKTLLVDPGTYTYHESSELRDYFRSTPAHNTIAIDGLSSSEPGSTFNWKTKAEARTDKWISENRFDFFDGSQNGYERLGDSARHQRSILFVKSDYWLIRDMVEGSGTHEFASNFHYSVGTQPIVQNDELSVGDESHRIFTFGDNGSWQQKESWVSNSHGKRVNAPLFRFLSHGEGPQEFFTFIMPVESGAEVPAVTEVAIAGGRAFVISFSGYTDLFIYNDDPSKFISNGIFGSNFRYTWSRLRPGEVLPDEFILIGGDRLSIADIEVFEPHEVNYASARRFGVELYIKTDLGRSIKRISPET